MTDLLKAEFYKLSRSWYFWGLTFSSLLLSSLLLLDSKEDTESLFSASLYNTPVLYFLILVFSALFIGKDFEEKTLLTYLCTGHRRGEVLFAKLLAYLTGCTAILAFPLLVHGAAGIYLLGERLPIDGGAFCLAAAALCAMCLLPFFFAVLFRDTGRALALSLVLFFLMVFILNGADYQRGALLLPMGQLRLLALGQLASSAPAAFISDIVCSLFLCGGSCLIFCRCDLK